MSEGFRIRQSLFFLYLKIMIHDLHKPGHG
jgi:hypothetical protein